MVYTILFLGTFDPVYFRSVAAFIGVVCVGLAYASSFGFCSYIGLEVAGVHNLLLFLLLGIGVDDMFVITSQIDRLDPAMSVEEKMKKGISHAGASITITSLTNCIAFLLGSLTSLPALSSFCVFAGVGVLFDFIAELTIFSGFLVYDLKR